MAAEQDDAKQGGRGYDDSAQAEMLRMNTCLQDYAR